MGGKSKKTTVGFWYKIAYHHGLGVAPIDAFLEYRGGDKPAWRGTLTDSGTISVNAPMLWGGEKDQGGIVGELDVMFGKADQEPNAYLAGVFGSQQSAWRGLATVVFKGGKFGAMNPYPQKPSYKIRKIKKGWDGDDCWNPSQAEIPLLRHVLQAQVNENFSGGLGEYALESGSFARFNVVTDGGLPALAISGNGNAIIKRPFGLIGLLRSVSLRFKPVEMASDDFACFDLRRADGLYVFGFNQRRQGVGRPTCYLSTGTSESSDAVFGDVTLVVGNWYRFEASFNDGAGSYACSIIDEATGITLQNLSLSLGGGQLQTATTLVFRHEGSSGEGRYADIQMVFDAQVIEGMGMNPAHILYYSRTQADMGRVDAAYMNEASFLAASDWFYSQGFGLCTSYDPSKESVEEFEQRIQRVAGCSLSRSLVDGQWYLDVANGEYDLETLPVLTDDDILEYEEQPTLLDSAVNSVSVKYFDPVKKETITTSPVQAPALISDFGTNHVTLEYAEIPTGNLAARVAQRELLARITPLRAFPLKTTRKPYVWRPNTYFRLQATKRRIADMVCILGEKSSGQLRSGAMTIKASQDVYSLPTASFVEIEPGVDTTPSQTPVAITLQRAMEAPYIEVCTVLSRADLAVLPPETGYLMAVAADPASSRDYTMMVDVGSGYDESANGNWAATARVVEASGYGDTAFTLSGGIDLGAVEVGTPALWGSEIVRLDSLDVGTGAVTFGRACGDTVPVKHAAGERIWFYAVGMAGDPTEYTDGETIAVKLLTNTGSQQLALGSATAMGVTFDSRAARPYPPGQFRINGQMEIASALGEITVTGVHRDRAQQADQLVDAEMAGIGPEVGTTYTVRYYVNEMLEHTDSGLSSPLSSYAPAGAGLVRVEMEAVRDGLASFQMHVREFTMGAPLQGESGALITTEDDEPIIMG